MQVLNRLTITDIISIQTVQSPRGREFHMQDRTSYGLSFCRSGKITYTMNGIKTISDPFHAVLLPKHGTYSLYGDESGIFPLINFQCDNLDIDTILSFPLHNPEIYWRDYTHLESLHLFPNTRLKAISVLYELLSRLTQHKTGHSAVLFPAIKYLEANYTDASLNNCILAKHAGVSEVYFRRLFTEHYGTTPKQYICNIRIQRAKQMLNEGQRSVSEISEACGFSGIHHFCRSFKQRTGMTPLEYANHALQIGL